MSVLRISRLEDAARICAILEEAKVFLRAQNVDQWQDGYPNADVVRADIARGESFVLEKNGRIVATACISLAGEKTYDRIYGGTWRYGEPYAVVHRMAVTDAVRGSGAGAKMFALIEANVLERGMHVLRVDTHENNRPMRHLLEKCGFGYCGIIYLSDGNARCAYDKYIGGQANGRIVDQIQLPARGF